MSIEIKFKTKRYFSFNIKFLLITLFFLVVFIFISNLFLNVAIDDTQKEKIISTTIQLATLVLGLVAVYFALKQLNNSEFYKLDELAITNLRAGQYNRSAKFWGKALSIKFERDVYLNLMENFLIQKKFDMFDSYIDLADNRSYKNRILEEESDIYIIFYLKIMRQLLDKNLGKAEKELENLINYTKNISSSRIPHWSFGDLMKSPAYTKIEGDHKLMAQNLIKYLNSELSNEDKIKFESQNYLLTI